MFTENELLAIAGMCETEKLFLEHVERRGMQTVTQQAIVVNLRMKVMEEVGRLRKASANPPVIAPGGDPPKA